jgi:hypothetical protein
MTAPNALIDFTCPNCGHVEVDMPVWSYDFACPNCAVLYTLDGQRVYIPAPTKPQPLLLPAGTPAPDFTPAPAKPAPDAPGICARCGHWDAMHGARHYTAKVGCHAKNCKCKHYTCGVPHA